MITDEEVDFLSSLSFRELTNTLKVISILSRAGRVGIGEDEYRGILHPPVDCHSTKSIFLRLIWVHKLRDPNNIDSFLKEAELPIHIRRMVEMV